MLADVRQRCVRRAHKVAIMAEFPLVLEAPDRGWAEHVQKLMQDALGVRGSVTLGLPGEALPGSPPAPGYVVTGIAVCDEPEDEMIELLTSKLVDYDVERRQLDSGVTKVVVRPTDS
jgi:hypothetical protein